MLLGTLLLCKSSCRHSFIPVPFRENSRSRKQLGSTGVQVAGDRMDNTFEELARNTMVTRGERALHFKNSAVFRM